MKSIKSMSLPELEAAYQLADLSKSHKRSVLFSDTEALTAFQVDIIKEFDRRFKEKSDTQVSKPSNQVEDVLILFDDMRVKYKIGNGTPLKRSFSRKNLVKARIKEKVDLIQFEKVIKSRFFLWHDEPDMVQYLCPETILRPSKFFKYLDCADQILSKNKKSLVDNWMN